MSHDSFDDQPQGARVRQSRGIFAGVPLIIVLVLLTVGALALFLNTRFVASLDDCRALYRLYPGAQIVSEQPVTFLQVTGSLRSVFAVDDAPDDLERAMNQQYARAMRDNITSGRFDELPSHNWVIEAGENGGSRATVLCP